MSNSQVLRHRTACLLGSTIEGASFGPLCSLGVEWLYRWALRMRGTASPPNFLP